MIARALSRLSAFFGTARGVAIITLLCASVFVGSAVRAADLIDSAEYGPGFFFATSAVAWLFAFGSGVRLWLDLRRDS